MRQIKFRGQRLDNREWVIGSLFNSIWVKSADHSPICNIFPNDMLDPDGDCWEDFASVADDYEVDPATVGQFTGLLDKNGKKIYEGDTLLIKGDVTAVVVWRNEGFDILDSRSWTSTNKGDVDGFVYAPTKTMVVIGNIHDNPELLKTE